MKIFNKPLWIVLSCVTAVLFVAIIIGGVIADSFKKTINDFFDLKGEIYISLDPEESAKIDSEYFKSGFVQTNEDGSIKYVTESNGYKHQAYDDAALWEKNVETARKVQREGTTILWNDNKALPLGTGKKVSLFSHSSVDFVYSGNGSGYSLSGPTLKTALTAAGFSVNNTLWDFYEKGAGKSYLRSDFTSPNEVPWSVLNTEANQTSFTQYSDAAIFVISRKAGESGATDSSMSNAGTISGDYFGLDAHENNTLKQLVALKIFKKIVVLINTANGLNFNEISAINGIDACLWVGQPGYEGINEIANILSGASVPSGHLVDTFMYDSKSAPAAENGRFSTYTNNTGSSWKDAAFQSSYMIYAENIYVGYKYFETRYEDAVLSQGSAASNAGVKNSQNNWVYKEEVAFPFGYGGSYTSFQYSDLSAVKNNSGNYDVKLTVKNTGAVDCADAVQIYIQKPYTAYDKQNGIEQASVNLCGYSKTPVIKAGEQISVGITVDDDAFKTYDDSNKKTYIREAGDYYITAGQDAHNAVNNILAAKGKTPANSSNVMDAEGNANLVKKFTFGTDDFTTYATSASGGRITNQFSETDWNTYSNKTNTAITYLSRSNWKDTYPSSVKLSANAAMLAELDWDKAVEADPEDKMPLYEQQHVFNLIDLKGLDYDHDSWDTLLDQLTLDEQINLLGTAYHGTAAIESIVKPGELTDDGPLGIRKKYQTNLDRYNMNFPCTPLLAASFNDELAYEVGYQMGEDMLHTGRTGIYAPAPNMHRTIYGGRAYEYYSEDAFISGIMCKQQVIGIQKTGNYVNLKHLALNDQESARHGVGIWANEQSIREIYLAAFQPSIEEGKATGVMSSFTRFGTIWSGACDPLNNKVLRGEWGFNGFVISDCAWRKYMGTVDGLAGGNDCILYEATDLTQYSLAKTNPTVAQLMRESTKRILYVVVNSNAMNGITSFIRFEEIRNWWQNAILALQIGLGVLAAGCIGMTVACFFVKKKNIKEKKDNEN